jgi:LysM repeat protein
MKSFKQYNEAYTDRFAHSSAEDDNKHLANIQDEKVLQRLNGFVGAIADKEYLQPEAAIKQLNNKLGIVGYNFPEPKISGDKGKTTVEVTQFGGRYGKTPDNSNGPMSKGKEIEDGDGISHKKDGGLKLEFNWEKQSNNTYKVFASLK